MSLTLTLTLAAKKEMDLLDLLEVDRDHLYHRDRFAASYCGDRWHEAGNPTEPKVLADFLDRSLKACVDLGLHYPSVLLKRLKQLQRGVWTPQSLAGGENPIPDAAPTPTDQRPDPDQDLIDAIRKKEQTGKFDDEMRALLAEMQQRARKRAMSRGD
jgi:hypothetical protein